MRHSNGDHLEYVMKASEKNDSTMNLKALLWIFIEMQQQLNLRHTLKRRERA